jgi:DNA repair exonuclease SbcCD ATPase subunit
MLFLRDVIDAGGGGNTPPPPPDPGRPRKITCEFCECDLGNSGEYKKLSDKAKGFREAEETIEKLNATISELRAEITALKAQIPAPVVGPQPEGARRGITL